MTAIRTTALGIAALLVAGLSAACSDDSGGPNPTSATTFSMTTPNDDDGALLVVLTGPALSNLKASSAAYQIYWRAVNASETRVIVVGDIEEGPLFTAEVDGAAGDISATVSEVATRSDQLRATTAGYSIEVAH